MTETLMEAYYFPGCSMATSARESNQSLVSACKLLGLKLIELDDWNCCGSSSAHSVDSELAFGLAARNLSLAEEDKPLLTMCPSCFRNLLSGRNHLRDDADFRRRAERKWGRINPDVEILSFLEIFHFLDKIKAMRPSGGTERVQKLAGLRVAPYYGCMTMFPPGLRRTSLPVDLMERQLEAHGAEVVMWPHRHRCCGTFLSATRPDITRKLVNRINQGALEAKVDCLVTACAMCQLNLEIRSDLKNQVPILHFSELLALALGAEDHEGWFGRHLADPRPMLREHGLIA